MVFTSLNNIDSPVNYLNFISFKMIPQAYKRIFLMNTSQLFQDHKII